MNRGSKVLLAATWLGVALALGLVAVQFSEDRADWPFFLTRIAFISAFGFAVSAAMNSGRGKRAQLAVAIALACVGGALLLLWMFRQGFFR